MREYFVYSDKLEMSIFVSKDELQGLIDIWVLDYDADPNDIQIFKAINFTYNPPVSSLVID